MYLNCFSTLILEKSVVKIQPNHLHYSGWVWCILRIPYKSTLKGTDSASDMWKNFFFFFGNWCAKCQIRNFYFIILFFDRWYSALVIKPNNFFLCCVAKIFTTWLMLIFYEIFFVFQIFQKISRLSMPNLSSETFSWRFQRGKMRSWVV